MNSSMGPVIQARQNSVQEEANVEGMVHGLSMSSLD